ncbi:MAG: HD domain-containing protein [Nitrospirae bacterium]|nr:HD domain-containing protein [Nitrospirota bacterium]
MEDEPNKALRNEKPKILFVDDEENVLRALKRLFLDEPYEFYTALSGREALAVMKEHGFAVIVSDQRMPEMSGSEFLGLAREIQPEAIRLVLTGYADVNAAINAINQGGAYRYITKPWNDADLVLLIRDAAETYRLKQENKYLTDLTAKQNDELKRWNTQLEVMVQEQTLDIQNKNRDLEALNLKLEKNFRKSIEAFSGLIEMREKSVSNHSRNVASLARQIAVSMQLSGEEVSNVLVASLLHDIGKIGVPDVVLQKQEEEMNEIEFAEYRRHPVRGQVAVEAIEGFHDIGLLIRHHHECVDGTGYPEGLKRSSIPLGSRIISVADAVDRMANSGFIAAEDYQKAMNHVEFYLDTRYDRQVYQYLAPIIRQRIGELEKQGAAHSEELEIHPSKLSIGMVLTRDVRSGTGLLILARGVVMNQKIIDALQRYYRMDPSKTGIYVKGVSGKPK